jgi:serine/threonine-protein kinase RIO1
MHSNEKLIEDIKNLIKFYEGIGQSNPQLETYIKKLYQELDKLTQEENNKNE